jgi:hypothetical protein
MMTPRLQDVPSPAQCEDGQSSSQASSRAALCDSLSAPDSSVSDQDEGTMPERQFGTIRVTTLTHLEPIDLAAWARRYAKAVVDLHRANGASEAA